ncbi:MAG: PD-(D/E)XK motif protein [Solirubrobacteraceae bacterium]
MIESRALTFEQLKTYVAKLSPAPSPEVRDIGFADESRSIALSRDQHGRVELVLVGDRLAAARPSVDRAMDYNDDWRSSNEGSFPANHIVFPLDVFFDSAAALICVELVEAGFEEDPVGAFAQVEPLIDRFIAGVDQIGDQMLMGLFGELTLLEALLDGAEAALAEDYARSWFGWRPSARDFQIGHVGVEVKTTSGSTSRHHVQGFHQVEVGHPVTDVAETSLRLLSVGVLPVPSGHDLGESIPSLVEKIRLRLLSPSAQTDFLDRVQQYGGDSAVGYRHIRDQSKARFQIRYVLGFERLYDLGENNLRILKRPDVAGFSHVDADSIEFKVDLPYPFRGEVNPISGLGTIAVELRNAMSESPAP